MEVASRESKTVLVRYHVSH